MFSEKSLWALLLFLVVVTSEADSADPQQELERHSSRSIIGRSESLPGRRSLFLSDNDHVPFQNSKPNKVNFLLRYMHRKSKEATFNPKLSIDGEPIVSEVDSIGSSDEEILQTVCPSRAKSLCKKMIDLVITKRPEVAAEIVDSIRNKPPGVQASRLLFHKLLDAAIRKVEDKHYDQALNMAIDFVATKNPYLLAASKTLDMTMH